LAVLFFHRLGFHIHVWYLTHFIHRLVTYIFHIYLTKFIFTLYTQMHSKHCKCHYAKHTEKTTLLKSGFPLRFGSQTLVQMVVGQKPSLQMCDEKISLSLISTVVIKSYKRQFRPINFRFRHKVLFDFLPTSPPLGSPSTLFRKKKPTI
jgi:hypothetical protein